MLVMAAVAGKLSWIHRAAAGRSYGVRGIGNELREVEGCDVVTMRKAVFSFGGARARGPGVGLQEPAEVAARGLVERGTPRRW
jgi:hypothetical protein